MSLAPALATACDCMPTWLVGDSTVTASCAASCGEPKVRVSVLVKCRRVSIATHIAHGPEVCPHVVASVRRRVEECPHARVLENCTQSVLDKIVIAMAAQYQLRPMQCSGCRVHELSNTPTFPLCSKCKNAIYCSKECQQKDWKAGHSRICSVPRELNRRSLDLDCFLEATVMEIGAMTESCVCSSVEERHWLRAMWVQRCIRCSKHVTSPSQMHRVSVKCRKETAANVKHLFIVGYCTADCRRRDMDDGFTRPRTLT